MNLLKRALTFVCELLPGPSMLNTLIAWANPPQPILAVATAPRPSARQ